MAGACVDVSQLEEQHKAPDCVPSIASRAGHKKKRTPQIEVVCCRKRSPVAGGKPRAFTGIPKRGDEKWNSAKFYYFTRRTRRETQKTKIKRTGKRKRPSYCTGTTLLKSLFRHNAPNPSRLHCSFRGQTSFHRTIKATRNGCTTYGAQIQNSSFSPEPKRQQLSPLKATPSPRECTCVSQKAGDRILGENCAYLVVLPSASDSLRQLQDELQPRCKETDINLVLTK